MKQALDRLGSGSAEATYRKRSGSNSLVHESSRKTSETDLKRELALRKTEVARILDSLSWKTTGRVRQLRRRGKVLLRRFWPYWLGWRTRIVLHSGLFDEAFYVTQNPGLIHRADAVDHYLSTGAFEGLDPHPLFDSSFYLERNPAVAGAGMNPLVHYLSSGAREGRDPHPLFDSSFYLERNPDVAGVGVNPLVHYLSSGAQEGRDPNPLFFAAWYKAELETRAPSKTAAVLESVASTASEARPRRSKRPTPVKSQETVYAFTSICLNYVPKARVLAATLKEHNPNVRVCLLVNEPVPEWVVDELDIFDEVAEVGDLQIPGKVRWIFGHTMVELCTATKGFYLEELLRRPDCKAVFYFDPDIAVFSSVELLLTELQHASILLTPHQTEPDNVVEAIVDNEICSLKHGVFNLGFLGVKPSPEGLRFAAWWRARLELFCVADIPNGLFTDQRWVDLAPAFFKEIAIIRHPGCNVATWNLSRRRVEGDFGTGFTVNGQSLVFYHFSGFDSGEQEVMLNKYGSRMPAAHKLRRWYSAKTERPEDERLRVTPWAYGFYRNGAPITAEQRKLYRQRADLQQAYPDPFDTSHPDLNYFDWFESEVLGQRPGEETVGIQRTGVDQENPLVHFVRTWPSEGVRPNPYFDPHFYLENNPDVAALGVDPLSHYLHAGCTEGRDPDPAFDTAFYMSQFPPGTTIENPLVHYFTAGRKLGLRVNPLFDPGTDGGKVRALKRWCGETLPVILMIGHHGGGGTEKHVRDLAVYLGERARCLLITPTVRKTIWLRALDQFLDIRLAFDPVAQGEVLVEVLHELGVCRVHIHHAFGNEHYLEDLVARLKLPFDFTAHDYYALAPNPPLVGDDKRFVGDALWEHDKNLLRNAVVQSPPPTLAAWRAAHEWLLREAERVIAPSSDVAARLQRHIGSICPVIAPHPESIVRVPPASVRRLEDGDRLTVTVLGGLSLHKGLRVLLESARLNASRSGNLSFQVIGEPTEGHAELTRAGVLVTGKYTDEEVQRLLRARSPDLLWYPAQWPETYSYTLSAGLGSGLPLVVPDIGAFAERVAGRAWTWVQPWDLEPEEWLAFFERIRKENFIPGQAPALREAVPGVGGDFYRAEYLTRTADRR